MSQKQRTCRSQRSSRTYAGRQGFDYAEAISAETVGSEGICMHLLTLPPLIRAKAYLHEHHETALYIMEGRAGMWYGDHLDQHTEAEEGGFLYIPAGMPHLPYNPSASEPCAALLARTDPNGQESVVLLPEPEALWDARLRRDEAKAVSGRSRPSANSSQL
ncbi:cupin domain-containing protein [Paenibacillus koleovorans]|uniref:cupin domain-containing protein n=1 Tax=Paenibacillus koleovorans TaxID=121608 RepID=UPI000FD8CC1A|nr:cupin domain-containing protein [Paenibacillus koleovorans]